MTRRQSQIISSENRDFFLEAGLSKSATFKRIPTKIAIQPGTLDYTNTRLFFKKEPIRKTEEPHLADHGDSWYPQNSAKFTAAPACFRRSRLSGITHKLIAAFLRTEAMENTSLDFSTDSQTRVQIHAADGIFYRVSALATPPRCLGIPSSPGHASPKPFQRASEVPEKGKEEQ
jgi:hypothetical protein